MRGALKWILIGVVVLIAIGAIFGGTGGGEEASDESDGDGNIAAVTVAEEPEETTTEEEPPPVPDPQARVTSNCDYLLGDFTESESGYRFLADARVRNRGNVGVVVRVTASWDQIGGAPIRKRKTVRVPIDRSKKVNFNLVATSDEIDRHQSAGYPGCRVKGVILDTFGEAQE